MIGGTDSGARLLPYYSLAERAFPILPDAVILLEDTRAGTFGLFWFRGIDGNMTPLDPNDDRPRFAGRDDVNITTAPYGPYVGFHESGHAFFAIVARLLARARGTTEQVELNGLRAIYWSLRGFPGSWWDAQRLAEGRAAWELYPDESMADAFSRMMLGGGEPWTNEYDRRLDIEGLRIWCKSIETEAVGDMDEQLVRRIARAEAIDAIGVSELRAREQFGILKDAFNDHDHLVLASTGAATDLRTGGPLLKMGNEPNVHGDQG